MSVLLGLLNTSPEINQAKRSLQRITSWLAGHCHGGLLALLLLQQIFQLNKLLECQVKAL